MAVATVRDAFVVACSGNDRAKPGAGAALAWGLPRRAVAIVGEGSVSVQELESVRERILPMLRFAAQEYGHRTPDGYPTVVDAPESGSVGIELDPSFALYVVSDGDRLYADYYYRSARNDARSSASRQKHGGLPFSDRRPLDRDVSDQQLRNLIAELMSRWNFQPGIIHISDS